jgi:hypothetical protein
MYFQVLVCSTVPASHIASDERRYPLQIHTSLNVWLLLDYTGGLWNISCEEDSQRDHNTLNGGFFLEEIGRVMQL